MSVRRRVSSRTGKVTYVAIAELGTDPITGKRRQEWLGTFATKREAEKAERAALVKIDQGTYIKARPLTVAEYLAEWLESRWREGAIAPATYEAYEVIIRVHLAPELGGIELGKLRPRDVAAVYDRLRAKGLSPARVMDCHTLLHSALQRAVRLEELASNPAYPAAPQGKIDRRKPQPWTLEQAKHFLSIHQHHPLIEYWRLILYTALRRSEALALRWSDIDLERQTVTLCMNYARDGKGGWQLVEGGKNDEPRVVILAPPVMAGLREHRDRQAFQRRAMGDLWQDHDLVFCREDGLPISVHVVRHTWNRLLIEAGLPHVRIHDMRHTAATLLRNAGMDLKVLQTMLGHKTFSMTADLYTHVEPELQRDAVHRLSQALDG